MSKWFQNCTTSEGGAKKVARKLGVLVLGFETTPYELHDLPRRVKERGVDTNASGPREKVGCLGFGVQRACQLTALSAAKTEGKLGVLVSGCSEHAS